MRTITNCLSQQQITTVLKDHPRVSAAIDQTFRLSDRTSFIEQSAVRVAQLLNSELPWPTSEPEATRDPTNATPPDQARANSAIVDFVEQWVIDVASMTNATVGAVREHLGDDGLMDFIHSLLIIEQRIRLDLAWQHLGLCVATDQHVDCDRWGMDRQATTELGKTEVATCVGRIAPGRHGDKGLTAALSEWQAAVVCLDAVDPITTELVRLRCANYHDCHT